MGTLGLIAECYDIDLEGLEPWDEKNVDKLIEVLEKDT
jgi:hypothetical protein